MFFDLDPLTIGLGIAIALAFRKKDKFYGIMTIEREEIYRNAMEYAEPDRLRKLAQVFTQHGLKPHATMLNRRADWRSRTPEIRGKHQQVFERAMQSENIEAILEIADSFEVMTATIMASKLRERVEQLRNPAPQVTVERQPEILETVMRKRQPESKEEKQDKQVRVEKSEDTNSNSNNESESNGIAETEPAEVAKPRQRAARP